MKYSALIGFPTDHSVSPVLYAELVKASRITEFYQHIRVNIADNELKQSIEAFKTVHFAGLSVTLPHKLEVMRYLDQLDPTAAELGAVNTVKLGKVTVGYNTDWVGIVDSIRMFGKSTRYRSATIFGTGGAARAAIYACRQMNIPHITVLYRHEMSAATKKLYDTADVLGIELQDYSKVASAVAQAELIINATSAGMVGKDPWPFDCTLLDNVALSNKVFLEAVFNPLETPLLRYFKSKEAIGIDGLWMMINQGVQALSIWLDEPIAPGSDELERIHHKLEEELTHHV